MKYPSRKYNNVESFLTDYFIEYKRASKTLNLEAIKSTSLLFKEAISRKNTIFLCGNGHSAAISNAFESDYVKCLRTKTPMMPNVRSLASNASMITCLANDISYDDIFSYQLESLAKSEDILVTISSSGNSENVVRAAQTAVDNKITCIAMTGFDGGRTQEIADINIHVKSRNYGVVEDVHQSILHGIGQFLRQDEMSQEDIESVAL